MMLGFSGCDPIHVVVVLDEQLERVMLVTVYRPSAMRWEYDWKTRKR
jgi:hypothetical protein